MQQQLCLTPDTTLLAVTTLSFDIAALELFLPLIVGASVVVADRQTTLDAHQLAAALHQHQITVMQATPATWRLLLLSGWHGKVDLTILCGGEALDSILAATLLKSGKALWNLYGPTETTIWSTAYRVETVPPEAGVMPLGRPLANQQCYVLDAQQQPVPVGVPGELYIGGAGLANGYYNRPDLTAARFVPAAKGRLYRTGDRVRYRAEGVLEYLGRLDHQVKLRGYRIELGEIESVLRQHGAVEAAVVMLRQEAEEAQLVAYVVASSQVEELLAELRVQMQAKLPTYMVPAAIVILDQLPLTPNGKLNRRALPAPTPKPPAQVVLPQTATERTLATIWQAVLQLDRVGITDNFFDLGGDSLKLIKVHSQLRQQFPIEVSVIDLFRYPTISSLAGYLSRPDLPPHAPPDRRQAQIAAGKERLKQRRQQRSSPSWSQPSG